MTEIKAYYYELARRYDKATKQWSDWQADVSFSKPNVPEGSIRNLMPLYEAPATLAAEIEECAKYIAGLFGEATDNRHRIWASGLLKAIGRRGEPMPGIGKPELQYSPDYDWRNDPTKNSGNGY